MTPFNFLPIDIPEDNEVLAERLILITGQLSCGESRYVDAHHIKHWADGGETSLDNLVKLCRRHHAQLQRGSYSIEVEDGSQLVFTTPSGSRIETSFFPLFENVSAERSQEALRAIAPDVDAHTCVSKWRVEACDYGMAIDALLERDKQPRRPAAFEA